MMGSVRWVPSVVLTAILFGSGMPVPIRAQSSTEELLRERIPLFEVGLGPHSRPIQTSSPLAQAFFDQGMQLVYSFSPIDAARSFREAQILDPACAMCFFGEAWALGPYLNGPMRPDAAPLAFSAIHEADRLSRSMTGADRDLILAMVTRYAPEHDPVQRPRLDTLYAVAMDQLHERYPHDGEVATLFAEALMVLEPRRGTWDIQRPSVQRIVRVLGAALERDVQHPGACHLYIHATESTTQPELAEACADHLGKSIPGASHMNHMPSHTFNRVGRWGDATRANIEAWHSDLKAEIGEGFAIYPSHNLHMLLYSASYDGQGAVAIQAAKDYTKIVPDGEFYRGLTKTRFGRFDEVLRLEHPPVDPLFRGLWDFSRGYAHLRSGSPDSAGYYLARVDHAAEHTPDELLFRGHTAASLLGITGGILRAEILREEGRLDQAVKVLRSALALEGALRYDEPEPLPFSVRHWLGPILIGSGDPVGAEEVFRRDLELRPRNGWSLLGLAQALEAQGRGEEAEVARSAYLEAWVRSDTWIRQSRF